MPDFIEIENPETGGTARVAESAFKHLEAKGWRRVEGPADTTSAGEEPDEEPDGESVPSWADGDDDETEEV